MTPRYRLLAYVCANGCVRWEHHEGVSTFRQIFQQNPDGCRFAIAELPPDVLLFDLWGVKVEPESWRFTPGATWAFSSVDAAVAAAVIRY